MEAFSFDPDQLVSMAEVPPDLRDLYGLTVRFGVGHLFVGDGRKPFDGQILHEGAPLSERIARGALAAMNAIWPPAQHSNKPALAALIRLTMTAAGWELVRQSGDHEATKAALGDALERSAAYIVRDLGADDDDLAKLVTRNIAILTGARPPEYTLQ